MIAFAARVLSTPERRSVLVHLNRVEQDNPDLHSLLHV
jgi:hypothetical protein